MDLKQVCIERTHDGGLGMPDLESHWLAERLAYLGRFLTRDAVWRRKASRTFPRLKSDPKAEGLRKPIGETAFIRECRAVLRNLPGSSDLSRPRKELYRELVVGSTPDPLSERHGWTEEEIRSHWNWAPGSCFLNHSKFSLTWRLARNLLPLLGLNYIAGLADMPDCARCGSGLEETAEHTNERFARSGIMLGSGRLASKPSSWCCSMLVTSLTTFYLHFRVRSVWYFSRS